MQLTPDIMLDVSRLSSSLSSRVEVYDDIGAEVRQAGAAGWRIMGAAGPPAGSGWKKGMAGPPIGCRWLTGAPAGGGRITGAGGPPGGGGRNNGMAWPPTGGAFTGAGDR